MHLTIIEGVIVAVPDRASAGSDPS